MVMPKFPEFVEPILRYLARTDKPGTAGQVSSAIAEALNLTEEDLKLQVPSGKPVYKDRVGWGFHWLKSAGLAETTTSGEWQLTASGRDLAAAHPTIPPVLRAKLDAIVKKKKSLEKESGSGSDSPAKRGDKKAYRLTANPLSSGGQADVYEATRKSDSKVFAFKRVRGKFAGQRMRREIEVQSSIEHENVMPIVDWDKDEYRWYVMPRGHRVMWNVPRPLNVELLCRIVKSVLAALQAASNLDHPHRDVKPQNIIELDEAGVSRWVLADWGLTRRALGDTTAQLTRSGELLGTEGFAPPEAYLDAHNVGLPGDIYSVGQVIAWASGVNPRPFHSPMVGDPWTRVVREFTKQRAEERPQTIEAARLWLTEAFGE